ncbi:MAG: Crp/Fnr family transcriptional regulator [Elusimicrobia bacterium]|nr:Crp/Fnr family transcriptional regulator [Elusimicrobiota bacterium]
MLQSTIAPNCRICPHRANCLFVSLDESSRKEWICLRKARIYTRGATVFHEGDDPQGVYVVCEGKVKIFKSTRSGRMLTTRVLPAGSLFGHRSLLAGEAYSAGTEAFVDSVVSRIDGKSFLGFLKRHWSTVTVILRQLARGVREGEDKARDIAFSTARARLAQAILSLAKRHNNTLIAAIQKKELAQVAGITPETCVRLLKKFEKTGVVKGPRREPLTVLNEQALMRIAGNALVGGQ